MERLTRRDSHGRAYFDNDGVLIRGANGAFHKKKDMTAHYIHDRFVALDKAIDRLAAYEDALPLERVEELAQAEKDGRLVVVPDAKYTDADGEKALKKAMWTCWNANNPITRYTADAIAEKLFREATSENPPLTLEQLEVMVGEPVYVIPAEKDPDWKPCWVICMEDYILVNSTTRESRVYLLRRNEDYGKTWLAYRRKPEEAGNEAD